MESIIFRGFLKGDSQGEPTSTTDFDFSESWPKVVRFAFSMPATTASQTVSTGWGLTTGKVLGIKADQPIRIGLNAGTPKTKVRGTFFGQISSNTLTIVNQASYTNGQTVYVFAAGL